MCISQGGWGFASDVLKDPSLAAAVAVLGSHYPGTTTSADAVRTGVYKVEVGPVVRTRVLYVEIAVRTGL